MLVEASQTSIGANSPSRANLDGRLMVFRKKVLKHQSMATTKLNWQQIVFNLANQKVNDFLGELQKLAKDAFKGAAHAAIVQFTDAKMLPHLSKSINQVISENSTSEPIVTYFENKLELKGFVALDEPQMNTVTQPARKPNNEETKLTRHHCKKPRHYRNLCHQLKQEKKQTISLKKGTGISSSRATNSSPNNNNKNNNNRNDRKSRTVYPPSETCVKINHSAENYFETNATKRSPS